MGWEQTSVSQCFQLLIVYCGGAEHTVRGVLQSSWRLADRRASGTRESGGGLENGSGEVKKAAEKRTAWMEGTKVSSWKHRVMRKVTKSRFPSLLFYPLPSSSAYFLSSKLLNVVGQRALSRGGWDIWPAQISRLPLFKKPPLVSRLTRPGSCVSLAHAVRTQREK